jgi:hypothetical protein
MVLGSAEIAAIAAAVTTAVGLIKKFAPTVKPWAVIFPLSALGEFLWLVSQPVLPVRTDAWAVFVGYGLICVAASGVYELTATTVGGVSKIINGDG